MYHCWNIGLGKRGEDVALFFSVLCSPEGICLVYLLIANLLISHSVKVSFIIAVDAMVPNAARHSLVQSSVLLRAWNACNSSEVAEDVNPELLNSLALCFFLCSCPKQLPVRSADVLTPSSARSSGAGELSVGRKTVKKLLSCVTHTAPAEFRYLKHTCSGNKRCLPVLQHRGGCLAGRELGRVEKTGRARSLAQ